MPSAFRDSAKALRTATHSPNSFADSYANPAPPRIPGNYWRAAAFDRLPANELHFARENPKKPWRTEVPAFAGNDGSNAFPKVARMSGVNPGLVQDRASSPASRYAHAAADAPSKTHTTSRS